MTITAEEFQENTKLMHAGRFYATQLNINWVFDDIWVRTQIPSKKLSCRKWTGVIFFNTESHIDHRLKNWDMAS